MYFKEGHTMTTANRTLTDHLSTLALVALLAVQATMLSYGARCVSEALAETRTQLAAVSARR
jgi:hypothetical protein